MEIYKKTQDDIFTKFLIFRDMRNRGYVVKMVLDLVLISWYTKRVILGKRVQNILYLHLMREHKKKLVVFKKH